MIDVWDTDSINSDSYPLGRLPCIRITNKRERDGGSYKDGNAAMFPWDVTSQSEPVTWLGQSVWRVSWISTTVTFISRVIFWINSRFAAVYPSTLICKMTNGSSTEAIASRPDKHGLWFWVRLAADESFKVGIPGVWPLVSMLCMLLLISLAQMSYPGGRRGRISSSRPRLKLRRQF